MLERAATALVVIDLQEKLLRAMHEREALVASCAKLARGMLALDVPIVWTEQNPEGLGPTVAEVASLLPGEPVAKRSFSCCGEPAFVEAVARLGRRQMVLAGIESHVCVWQTAADLLAAGHEVHVCADAVSSRTPANRDIGLERARDAGAAVTSVEMALFELLRAAEGDAFKQILPIVR